MGFERRDAGLLEERQFERRVVGDDAHVLEATKDARASAQGLFNFLILGFGPFVANLIWPSLETHFKVNGVVQYQTLFLFPAGSALVAAILLALFFHPPRKVVTVPEEDADWMPPEGDPGAIAAGFPKENTGVRRES